jgi:chromosome segregation ATPase
MKNFQRNLFILLALALCGTCAYQWYLQAIQFNALEQRNRSISSQAADIQGLTNRVKRADDEINQLKDRITELKQAAVSNDQWAISERREVARLESDGEFMTNEIVQYKAAVSQLDSKLTNAFAGEKELAAQRDEFVKKLNDSIKAQNDLTTKYNELVDRFNKLQAASATNAPAK